MASDDSKLFAFLGVFLTVIGFIIVYAVKKNDRYAKFYAKQGLLLFIAWVAVWIIGLILAFIPFIGYIIRVALYILLLAAWVVGIIYSLSDQEKNIPVIGQYAKMIKI